MEPLSDTLKAVTLQTVSRRVQPLGSTMPATTMIRAQPRENPLTASQITNVASLVQSLEISIQPEITERWRWIEEENRGEYLPAQTGNFIVHSQNANAEQCKLLRAAARPATADVLAVHLGNLALHKRITNLGAKGVSTLVRDYAERLKDCAEMAVIDAINEIIETDANPFYPQFAQMLKLVERQDRMYREALRRAEDFNNTTPQIAPPKPAADEAKPNLSYHDLPVSLWKKCHAEQYIDEARGMLELAKANPTMFNADDWAATLADRCNEMALKGFTLGTVTA